MPATCEITRRGFVVRTAEDVLRIMGLACDASLGIEDSRYLTLIGESDWSQYYTNSKGEVIPVIRWASRFLSGSENSQIKSFLSPLNAEVILQKGLGFYVDIRYRGSMLGPNVYNLLVEELSSKSVAPYQQRPSSGEIKLISGTTRRVVISLCRIAKIIGVKISPQVMIERIIVRREKFPSTRIVYIFAVDEGISYWLYINSHTQILDINSESLVLQGINEGELVGSILVLCDNQLLVVGEKLHLTALAISAAIK